MALINNLSRRQLVFVGLIICPMIFAVITYPFFFPEGLQPAISILSGLLGFSLRELFENSPDEREDSQ